MAAKCVTLFPPETRVGRFDCEPTVGLVFIVLLAEFIFNEAHAALVERDTNSFCFTKL